MIKTIKITSTIIFISVLITGYILREQQRETQFNIINLKLEKADIRDSITNRNIIEINRKFYSKFALVLREDYCNTVKTHIDKKHNYNHKTCKHLK